MLKIVSVMATGLALLLVARLGISIIERGNRAAGLGLLVVTALVALGALYMAV